MIVGIVSCIPCCSMLVLCGAPGVLLGVTAVGLSIAPVIGKAGGRGFGIAGLVTGLFGILLGLVPLGFLGIAGLAPALGPKPPLPMPKSKPREPLPPVLTGQELTAALTGPLARPRDPDDAAEQLRKAVEAFGSRRRRRELYECVRAFRLHLASAGLARCANPEHARMFDTAGQALVDAVVRQYRAAGDLEYDGNWRAANEAYRQVLLLVPDEDNEVCKNVARHQAFCTRKAREGKEGRKRGGVSDGRFPSVEAE